MDAQEQEALISLRDARKNFNVRRSQEDSIQKGGGRARSTGKSIDELKKVTPCNRCGAVTGMKIAHNLPEAKRRDPPAQKVKEKVVGSGEEHLMEKDEVLQNYPIVEVYDDSSKTQSSHMKVPPGYAVLDCGAAKSLCGAKLVAQMAQTRTREGKRVGDERDTEAIDESYHFRGVGNQIGSSFMKLRVPGSIDGKEVSFAPSVPPGDIPPLVGSDHLIPWGCSIHVYPDEGRLEIPSRGIDAKLLLTTSNHILVNLQILQAWNCLIMMCGPRNEEERVERQIQRVR